jgi:hypothetical protein
MVNPSSFTTCHPGNAGAKWTTLQATGQQKSEAIHLTVTRWFEYWTNSYPQNQIARDHAKSYNVDATEISVVWKKQILKLFGHIL